MKLKLIAALIGVLILPRIQAETKPGHRTPSPRVLCTTAISDDPASVGLSPAAKNGEEYHCLEGVNGPSPFLLKWHNGGEDGDSFTVTIYRLIAQHAWEIAAIGVGGYGREFVTEPISIDPTLLWFSLNGLCGLHPPCSGELYSFDGRQIRHQADTFEGSYELIDLDGDGVSEMALYNVEELECHVCNSIILDESYMRWNVHRRQFVELPIPLKKRAEVPTIARKSVLRAEAEMAADLWLDAETSLQEASAAAPNDRIVRLYAAVVARKVHLKVEPHNYMNEMLFSGEYEGIAEIASSHSPQEIFSASLLPFRGKDIGGADAVEQDEYAKDNRTYFAHSAFQMSNEAVKARPDKASAWFIRAWGAFYFDAKYLMGYQPEIAEPFLKVPGRNAIILASLEQAAALRDPRREFYVNCLNWWRTNGATAQPPTGVPPR